MPNELEAVQIVYALEEHGIRAMQTGGFTSGFQAEAPGLVSVMVRHADYDRATALLTEKTSERADIDWSTIDSGDASGLEDPSLPSDEDDHQANPRGRRFRFSMKMILGLQTLLCLTLAFLLQDVVHRTLTLLLGRYAGLVAAVVIIGGMLALTIFATARIASDPASARQAWKFASRAFLLCVLVFGLFQLIAVLLRP